MSFNSFVFWLIFPGIFLIHWLLPDRIAKCRPRHLFLLIVSYLFYANWKPAYMLILLAVTLLTYVGALLFESKESFRKSWFVSFIIVLALIPLLDLSTITS